MIKFIKIAHQKIKQVLILSFATLLLFGCSNKPVIEISQKKPNIIFILTDDQRWDAIGYAGNKLAYTPEMDQLAEKAVFFKNTIATTPICAASRASIISGLQERTHNYSFTTGEMKEEYMQNAYPRILKKAGYYTGLYGKFGVKYKHLDSLYNVSENYDLRYDKKDITSYYYKTLGKDTVHLTRYTGEKAIDFIKKAPSDKPFCLQLSFSAPHASDNTVEQYFWDEKYNHILENTTIPDANNSSDEDYNKLPQRVKDGFNRLRWFWRNDTPEKYQHSVKGYYRMIAGIDDEISKIRKELEQKGIADNTIIILMGDNGFFLGERQISGKWLMYENSIKVPLIIYDPRNKNHKDVDEMALNIDVPATILDFAGVQAPATWHGKSLKPFVDTDKVDLKRDTILIEHLWDFKNIAPSEGVRTKDWKYFRYVDDKSIEELYNLKEDPRETNNLIKDEKHQEVSNKLRNKLEALILEYRDPFEFNPINVTFNKNQFSWEVSNNSQKQTGYQILVSSSKENNDNNIGDVWNSDKVESDAKQGIKFVGNKLESQKTYFYKMRIYDELNRTGRYSAPQKFTN
ncbi:sulfatase family protein [Polaribacter glomeratus]|uniref:Sulfatase n=1 Tax=Polaribacter glomeratus TaxID=102 RepID=A0A2S7WH03_9FLAO|nr:sulfatase [Polaribacter glomeratus]PQJ76571.1 sulfatase [Polaribacter glomeratus]TXD67594.1 sulfatase [Polaribacter glomeratus]